MSKGFAAFYLTIVVLALMAGIAGSIFLVSRAQFLIIQNSVKSNQAFFAAESGIEDAVFRIKNNKKYDASYSFPLGKTNISLSVTSQSGEKIIRSTGSVLNRSQTTTAVLKTGDQTISFYYGAQVDRGGLTMSNNAKVVGNIYSNGSIEGSGSSSQITGDAWVAGSVVGQPDQQWTTQDSDFEFGLRKDDIYYLDTAQKFIPSVSKTLNKVSLYLKKVGSPPDQTVRILNDNNGHPGKTVLGSGTLTASKVTNVYSWVDVSFDPPSLLTAGQSYWLMIDVSRNDNNYWVWAKDSTDNYSQGTGKYSADWSAKTPVWNNVNGDLNFKTIMGGESPTFIDSVSIGASAHANTLSDCIISGDAYYQNIDAQTQVSGEKYPGSQDPATKDLPISLAQISEWEQGAEGGGVINGNYQPSADSVLGPVKINGNLTFPGNGTVTIAGPVWVVGNILATNNVKIKLKSDLGSGVAIVADNPADRDDQGKITLSNNTVTEDNSSGYLLFVSVNESLDPYNPAITISNNVNSTQAQSIVFALSGLINISNNAKFKEISGYGLKLNNNTQIVYEQGLINASFSTGPGAGWQIESWQETE